MQYKYGRQNLQSILFSCQPLSIKTVKKTENEIKKTAKCQLTVRPSKNQQRKQKINLFVPAVLLIMLMCLPFHLNNGFHHSINGCYSF